MNPTVVQIEFWHLVMLLIAFIGFAAAAFRLLLSQFDKRMDERFNQQEAARASATAQWERRFEAVVSRFDGQTNQWQQLERDMLRFQAEMPLQYVRREDYIRGQSVLEAKMDALAMRIENLQLKGVAPR
jgi:hypothetical protein